MVKKVKKNLENINFFKRYILVIYKTLASLGLSEEDPGDGVSPSSISVLILLLVSLSSS